MSQSPNSALKHNVGQVGDAANSGGHDDVPRVHFPFSAVGTTQHNGPSSLSLVVCAALKLGSGPVVELHAFDIGLEPAGKFVFRDVGRPVTWKRHVGQVVNVNLIVQSQRVIAIAPVVTNALFTVHDQRIDL